MKVVAGEWFFIIAGVMFSFSCTSAIILSADKGKIKVLSLPILTSTLSDVFKLHLC